MSSHLAHRRQGTLQEPVPLRNAALRPDLRSFLPSCISEATDKLNLNAKKPGFAFRSPSVSFLYPFCCLLLVFGCILVAFGYPFVVFGRLLVAFGYSFVVFGRLLASFQCPLSAFWSPFGRLWRPLIPWGGTKKTVSPEGCDGHFDW